MAQYRINAAHLAVGGFVATLLLIPGTALAQTAGYYATEPHYGSPNSMQFQATSTALDLATMEDDFDADGSIPTGDADTIGGAFTYFKAGFQGGERYELRYQHARRLHKGSRARLLIDVPIAAAHADHYVDTGVSFGGATAVYGTVSVGIELPAKPNWLITPRIAYSNLQAPAYFNNDGEMITASVTSRYKIAQVGRGDLTIGNMVALTQTLKTFLSTQPGFAPTTSYVLRNGLAYQLPLKTRMFGRQSSIRASYVFTYNGGTPGLAYKQLHEVGLNIGVRTREAEQKNGFEQLRFGILYTHGKNEFDGKSGYDAVTATLGYRF